jgi:hypothetical protein
MDSLDARAALRRLLSRLLCRYNGFMLGVTMAVCEYPFARRRFPALRHRMQEYLEEVGLDRSVLRDHEQYMAEVGDLVYEVLERAQRRSPDLVDFIQFGLGAVLFVVARSQNEESATEVLRTVHRLIDRV